MDRPVDLRNGTLVTGGHGRTSRPPARPRLSLVVLGLAAVVAIYALGAWRTRAGVEGSHTVVSPTISALRPRYLDGTYTGWGRRRHGDVQATVVIRRGRVASVDITACRTRFPCSYITAMPAQVIARQSTQVDAISGATESAEMFASAIAEALSKAAWPEPSK